MLCLLGAIRVYCAGRQEHLFERARQLAGNNPTFSRYIEEQYNSWATSNHNAEGLVNRDGVMPQHAIDMLVQRGDWPKVRGRGSIGLRTPCLECV